MKIRILFLFVVISGMIFTTNLFGQMPVEPTPAVGDFGSIASGNASDVATWGNWNGTTWVAATTIPTTAIGCWITSGTSVDVNTILNYKKYLVIQAGATLTMTSTGSSYANKVYATATGTPKQATVYINGDCGTLTNPVNMSWASSSSTYYVTGTSVSTPYFVFLRPSSASQTVVIDKDINLVVGVPSIYAAKESFICTINSGKTVTAQSFVSAGTASDGTTTDGFIFTLNVNGTLTIADSKNLNLTNLVGKTSALNIGLNGTLNLGGSLLAPSAGAGTVTLTATSGGTVNFNGTGASTLDVSKVTSPALSNLKINNAAGVTLGGSIGVNDNLTMTQGNVALNGKTLTLGTAIAFPGTLTHTAGYLTGTGTFVRWFNSNIVIDGTLGLFPMGVGTNNRSLAIGGTPSTGGPIAVSYNDASTVSAITFTEDQNYVNRYDANWVVTPSGPYTDGAMTLKIHGDGIPGITSVADLDLSAAAVIALGVWAAPSGTITAPVLTRNGLTQGTIVTNPFYIASTNTSALPVEMTSFTASMQSASCAILKWSTATEVNNNGFEIQRRVEGTSDWANVSFVFGAGISNSQKEYSYQDVNLAPGVYVYRIKQIDNDGTFKFSASAQVDLGVAKGFELLSNYPNPFNPETNIRFSVPEDGFASLKVFNVLGQEVATLFSGMAQAGHYIPATFNAGNMASGIYFSRLEYNGKSIVQRMLLTK